MTIKHMKELAETQFDAMKGSPQHAAMTMNRVWLNFDLSSVDLFDRQSAFEDQEDAIRKHLRASCRDYYFIGRRRANNDFSLRIYFLKQRDMIDFMVWAKLRLPAKIEG